MSALTEAPQLAVATCVCLEDFSHGERFLLQQFKGGRYPGHWGFAGGKVDPAETPWEAARRELIEEADVTVYGLEDAGMWSYDRWEDSHFVCLFFKARTSFERAVVTEPDKTVCWEWLTKREIRDIHNQHKLLLGCARYFDL